MSNKKDNNFFTDFDAPFVLPPHEEYDLSALIDDYHAKSGQTTSNLPDLSAEFVVPDLSAFIDEVQTGQPLHAEKPIVPQLGHLEDDSLLTLSQPYQETMKSHSLHESLGAEDRVEPVSERDMKRVNARTVHRQEVEEMPQETGRKGRRKKTSGIMTGILYFAIIVGVSAVLAAVTWLAANDVLALMAEPDNEIIIVVGEDVDLNDITQQLQDAGRVQFPWLFRTFANFTNATERIVPGEHAIQSHYDYRAILSALRGRRGLQTVRVTIPEGWHLEQIFRELDTAGVALFEDLMYEAEHGEFPFEWLDELDGREGVRHRLEGFLFPETYDFFVGEDPNRAITRMLRQFDQQFPAEWREEALRRGLSFNNVVTIASLIERETGIAAERDKVSSVIHNRLNNWANPLLQIDAAVVYAWLPYIDDIDDILNAWGAVGDLRVDSPYNLYTHPGLPPGPIGSPRRDSIRAAIDPAETNYFFYVLLNDGTGEHVFTRTAAEHEAMIQREWG
ncbi:MAG: endolytic transglycosylase MltG [Oscillospiraceae bacterium]|nr:endolytic transglycosylase MltG [Oscillospiraceae bacterium]